MQWGKLDKKDKEEEKKQNVEGWIHMFRKHKDSDSSSRQGLNSFWRSTLCLIFMEGQIELRASMLSKMNTSF